MSLRVIFIILVLFTTTYTVLCADDTDRPIITSFTPDGKLTWEDSSTTGTYRVEWTSSMKEEWQSSFDGLTGIVPGSNGVTTVDVPMFYKVVRIDETADSEDTKGTLVLDSNSSSPVLTADASQPKALWATAQGTIYDIYITSKNAITYPSEEGQLSFIMGVGQSADFNVTVKPEISGSFYWWTSSTNLIIDSPNSAQTKIRAISGGTAVTFGVKFKPANPYWEQDLYCFSFRVRPNIKTKSPADVIDQVNRSLAQLTELRKTVVVGSERIYIVFENQNDISKVAKALVPMALTNTMKIEMNSRYEFNRRFN